MTPIRVESIDACFFTDGDQPRLQAHIEVTFPEVSSGLTKAGDERTQRLGLTLYARTDLRKDLSGCWEFAETGGCGFWEVHTSLGWNPNPDIKYQRLRAGWQTAIQNAVHQMFSHAAENKVMGSESIQHLYDTYSQVLTVALEGSVAALMQHGTPHIPDLSK